MTLAWTSLCHPMTCPVDRWWLTSANLDQLPATSFEELVATDSDAIVVMYDCNSQGREYWRVFSWRAHKRYLNIVESRARDFFLTWVPPPGITVRSLFGDQCFWLLENSSYVMTHECNNTSFLVDLSSV